MYDKIYSRKRFIIKPLNLSKLPNNKLSRKTIKITSIIIISMLVVRTIFNCIDPVFETICEEKAKSIATIIMNEQSTIVMNKYQYEELYSIEKDLEGNIVIIKSNVAPINNMMSDLAEGIQTEFNNLDKTSINISLGNIFGTYMLSGLGPDIPIKVMIMGNIDTDVKSEFIAQGINQTLHRVYVEVSCNIKIITPAKNFERQINNQFIIAEHVIIGNIPDAYYNLEGIEKGLDTLNVIE